MTDLSRHIAACNTARLPGGRVPLRIGAARVGFVAPDLAPFLADAGIPWIGRSLVVPRDAVGDLTRAVENLGQAGKLRLRREMFDIRVSEAASPLGQIDRGALPALGMLSLGVHVNGLVRRGDGLHVWVGHRAADKALDPGKLDHLVAGGVPAGLSPWATLLKEGEEEAGLSPTLLARARPVARLAYAMERPEGLRRDVLFCYDLVVPEDVTPHPNDGEVAQFELWPIARVRAVVAGSDAFKFNVNLVLIDLFRRLHMS